MALDEKTATPSTANNHKPGETSAGRGDEDHSSQPHKRKRFDSNKLQHGSRSKRKDLGRGEWSRQPQDKRARNEAEKNKRRRTDHDNDRNSALPKPFSKDEIDAEERKPKRKVAVMIGYSGSGYKGMQINTTEKTIEGDLFTAFVAAGAISKANADDPKKSALVRCARTDKGVHAAGNVISLKLIVEDPDIVEKINANLSPQIRVWGIERTTGGFSCYQACDSRWYEYLIPTHAFLPPHPNSFLGKKLVELAEEAGDRAGYDERQREVASFWAEGEEKYIKPILDSLDVETRELCQRALYESDINPEAPDDERGELVIEEAAASNQPIKPMKHGEDLAEDQAPKERTEEAAIILDAPKPAESGLATDESRPGEDPPQNTTITQTPEPLSANGVSSKAPDDPPAPTDPDLARKWQLDTAIKQLKAAYIALKKSYRIDPTRLSRVREALTHFLGTCNFHNYTIQKSPRDPSAKRLIKSFVVSDTSPLIIKGRNAEGEEVETEWLSLRIHGQSFMMHQIRKMVGMLALCIRCGTPLSRIKESFGQEKISIPKVPGLGLLLERPVFDSYNEGVADKFERKRIDFKNYEREMEEFKQREIYDRIWREEEKENVFHAFFAHVDNFKESSFLWVSSKGLDAVKAAVGDGEENGSKKSDQKTKNEDNQRGSEALDVGLESEDEEAARKEVDGQGEG